MKWSEISELEKIVPFPDGYTGQKLRREDIPLLIESIKKWYPERYSKRFFRNSFLNKFSQFCLRQA